MGIRNIEYTVSAGGISPSNSVFGGTQKDHNPTEVDFHIDGALKNALDSVAEEKSGEVYYRFDVYDGGGNLTTNLSPFNYCYALENLTIEGTIQADFYLGECPALTRDSLLSVIDALKDTTSTKYLTLSSTAEARLTNEDIAIAVNKGWTIEVW